MTLRISVLCRADSIARLDQMLADLSGQSLPPEEYELVVVDRTHGHAAAGVVAVQRPAFPVRILAQGEASCAESGNLAVFGASAPLVLSLDPATRPEPDLLKAHVAAHMAAHTAARDDAQARATTKTRVPVSDLAGGSQADSRDGIAVLGAIAPAAGIPAMAAILAGWPRLFSFGLHQPAPPPGGGIWGGSISIPRACLIRFHLFDPLERPGFEDLEPSWRLAERPFIAAFAPAARAIIERPMAADDLIARAHALGRQEDIHRRGRRLSLLARLGGPAHWRNRRAVTRYGVEGLYAEARRIMASMAGSPARELSQQDRQAIDAALYAAWRDGRRAALPPPRT